MCKTRGEAVDNSQQTREDLFIFARNFAAEADRQEAEIAKLQREKQARVYYQNIVYKVCTALDAIEGRRIEHGEGIVCGTLETPETEVQQAMERTKAKIDGLQAIVAKLPKCWGLKDGKLVQDVPVVPEMTLWRKWPDTAPECEAVREYQVKTVCADGVKLRGVYHTDGHRETPVPLNELFDTYEAGKAAEAAAEERAGE